MEFYESFMGIFQGWNLLLLILTIVIVLITAFCFHIKNIHRQFSHIPGPPLNSFLTGHASLVAKEMEHSFFQQFMLKLTKQYGHTYKLHFMHATIVVTCDPDSVKDLLVTGHHPKPKMPYEPFSYLWGARLIGNGILTIRDHKEWVARRAIVNPCFQRSYLKKLTSDFNMQADALMSRLSRLADGSTKFQLLKEFNHVALDVIAKLAFGIELNSIESEDNEFTQAILMAFKGISIKSKVAFTYALNPFNWKFIYDVRKSCKFLRKFGKKLLTERTEAKNRGDYIPDDILTHIIQIKEENPELDTEEIIDDFVLFFVAGQETTANLLGFLIEYVGRNKEVFKRLRDEIDEVIGAKSVIDYGDLDRLVYLDMVIKETLRLASPASIAFRELEKDHMVGGYKVPKGTMVIVSSFVSGRYEGFYDDPEKFDPQRFSPSAEKKVNTYTYFPFTLGPRTCIGKHFADMEVKIIMSKFMQRFNVDIDLSRPLELEEILTIRPKGGVLCTLSPREEKEQTKSDI